MFVQCIAAPYRKLQEFPSFARNADDLSAPCDEVGNHLKPVQPLFERVLCVKLRSNLLSAVVKRANSRKWLRTRVEQLQTAQLAAVDERVQHFEHG